jgi:tetratricopeptide (TPR) repeat protein
MNLSVLERMARDGDMSKDAMRYLLNCRGECGWLDYKETIILENDKSLCDFTKDVLALKNVGGGYIVVGVQDKTWKPIGLPAELPYDSRMVRDKVRHSSNVDLDIGIVHHRIEISSSTGLFALIFVRSSRKRKHRRAPTLVARDFCASSPYGLRRGEIYVRKGDSTTKVASEQELADLLDDLESQADQDELTASGEPSPFAIEDGLYRLLEKGFDRFIGRENLRRQISSAVFQDPRIWIINVHGPGGVGKSALVNWAIYEFYDQRRFESIIHLTAKETVLTPTGIVRFGRTLYSLENLLDHVLNTFQETPPDGLDKKKKLTFEVLSTWRTLLVLDNLETLQDGRVLEFIQQLPTDTRAKVLITSRQKTGSWELPLRVAELNVQEVAEFLEVRVKELGIDCPYDKKTADRVWQISGGLPLAIQWILGRCTIEKDLDKALAAVGKRDSPVLEFSFRNVWSVLSSDAKAILAAMTIFPEPPTFQQIAIATEFDVETIEKALAELADVTLVSRYTHVSDGRILFIALPITLSFAKYQLETMGEFEVECRQRYHRYSEQMELQESELFRFRSTFERFGIETDNEKRAAILCQRGFSEMAIGNIESADMLFKEARELAPQSSYVYAMSASYELARNRLGRAEEHIKEACVRAKATGSLCYMIKARILDEQRDRYGRLDALAKALEFDADNLVIVHQLGVALSRAGRPEEAIKQFDMIIEREKHKSPPTLPFRMALKTRMINLKRLGRIDEIRKDLSIVDEMQRKYHHLSSELNEFEEFRDQ